MAQDKETVIQRVINFLYDALDRFRDTMNDLNQNVSVLMNSLKKAEGDLSGTGYQRTGADRSAVLTSVRAGAQHSSSSREKLIALLSGQSVAPSRVATPAPRPAAGPPRPPAAGPPRPPVAGPPRPPAAGPPRPTAVGPPRPPAAAPSMAGPPRPPIAAPPAAGPPRPAAPAAPMAGPARPMLAGPPRTAAPAAGGGGAPTISGLRDEMLKELKRLKSIMKGEK